MEFNLRAPALEVTCLCVFASFLNHNVILYDFVSGVYFEFNEYSCNVVRMIIRLVAVQ